MCGRAYGNVGCQAGSANLTTAALLDPRLLANVLAPVQIELRELERYFRYCSGLRERRPLQQRHYFRRVLDVTGALAGGRLWTPRGRAGSIVVWHAGRTHAAPSSLPPASPPPVSLCPPRVFSRTQMRTCWHRSCAPGCSSPATCLCGQWGFAGAARVGASAQRAGRPRGCTRRRRLSTCRQPGWPQPAGCPLHGWPRAHGATARTSSPFTACSDRQLRTIVLAIRGTHSFKDMFTSLTGKPLRAARASLLHSCCCAASLQSGKVPCWHALVTLTALVRDAAPSRLGLVPP